MSDIVLLEIIKTAFWLSLFGIIIYNFKSEAKLLIQSLSSFKVAGAAFELKDKKETIRSYVLLAETLIDILSRSEQIEETRKLIHPSQIEKLGVFALKYTKEVSEDDWNEGLLKNIAYLLLRDGRDKHAVELYDALLSKRPDHADLLNLKALALITSRMSKKAKAGEELLSNLVERFPEIIAFRFNYALALSLIKDDVKAVQEMMKVIDAGYWNIDKNFLNDPLFHYVRESHSESFKNLNKHLDEVMKKTS